MSRGSNNNSGSVFLRIGKGGKIVETVAPEHPRAVSRINTKGREVFERIDEFVEGVITFMKSETRDLNGEAINELKVRIEDGPDTYQLAIDEDSGYWSSFVMRLPNLDMKKPVQIKPYSFTDKTTGKPKTGINLFQGGNKVPSRFTKESPGKMPQGIQVMFQGKVKWDFFERDQFLKKVVEHIADKMRVEGEAITGETGMPVHQVQQAPPPVTQAAPQPVMAPMAPPPSAPYPQPQHITSDVDDLPW